MPIITLTTDFGEKDPYVGAVKGAIYKELKDAKIVDISHCVSPFHIIEASYIIKNSYQNFPKGSIHIIGIDGELNPENKHIAVKLDGHYFICADNGIISMLTSKTTPEKIIDISALNTVNTNFPTLDVFVKVACHIAKEKPLEALGTRVSKLKILTGLKPVVNKEKNLLIGNVIYIDNYGNVVSNIHKTLFQDISQGRNFKISARKAIFNTIYNRYSDAINFELAPDKREEDGKKLALWNSSEYLELAIYRSNIKTEGGASSLFGLEYRDTIAINFE